MRTKYNKRRFKTIILILVLLIGMSIGYSYINNSINEEGIFYVKNNTWDVHFDNLEVSAGSVEGDQVPIAAHILGDTTKVEYSIILKNPGEYYEFTLDTINAGSINAMIDDITTTIYEIDGKTEKELPKYLEYDFTYSDGSEIIKGQSLNSNKSEKIKVKVKFKEDIQKEDLPNEDETLVIKQELNYVQKDDSAIDK